MLSSQIKHRLEKEDILNLYKKGFKKTEEYLVGVEYERLPVSLSSFKSIDYQEGICDFL